MLISSNIHSLLIFQIPQNETSNQPSKAIQTKISLIFILTRAQLILTMSKQINIKYKMLSKKKNEKAEDSGKMGKHARKISKLFEHTDQTIATTKEKTYATIEQTAEFHDHKISQRSTHFTSRRQYLDQLEACELSPFSSPEREASPKVQRVRGEGIVKQKQNKKKSKKPRVQKSSTCKKGAVRQKKECKTLLRKHNQQKKVSADFKNQFIKRMGKDEPNKKITEVSDEELESSIRKHFKPQKIPLPLQLHNHHQQNAYKTLHSKIKTNNQQNYPCLSPKQRKFLSAIVLIQKVWRQRKIKNMIDQVLSSQISQKEGDILGVCYEKKEDFVDGNSGEGIDIVDGHEITFENLESESVELFRECNQKDESPVRECEQKQRQNLQDLEVSGQFSDMQSAQNSMKIIDYIDMYRELTLTKKAHKLKKTKRKPNIFNIPQSLSQNCLLDRLYRQSIPKIDRKVVEDKKKLKDKFIFPVKLRIQGHADLEHSKIEGLSQKFQKESVQEFEEPQNKEIKPQEQTVKSIGALGSDIIQNLINEFAQEFLGFAQKKCLKKKRKTPGITITSETILNYLKGLDQFLIQNNYKEHLQTSFTKLTAMSFLKIFRIEPEEDIFPISEDNLSEEDEFSWPILPPTAFFEYQTVYEQNVFQIKQSDKKYSNFLLGLIKIHNKCIIDSLAQCLEKQRVDSLVLPWDTFKSQSHMPQLPPKVPIQQIFGVIKDFSETGLGELVRYQDPEKEEQHLLQSLKKEYKREGKQWNPYSQRFELRLEITEAILNEIWNEATAQINLIIHPELV